jgi:hypothetical protein
MKRGKEIIPEEEYRLRSEDIYVPDPTTSKFGVKGKDRLSTGEDLSDNSRSSGITNFSKN